MTRTAINIKGYENRIKVILSAMFGMSVDQINTELCIDPDDIYSLIFRRDGYIYDICFDHQNMLVIEKHIGDHDMITVAKIDMFAM